MALIIHFVHFYCEILLLNKLDAQKDFVLSDRKKLARNFIDTVFNFFITFEQITRVLHLIQIDSPTPPFLIFYIHNI